MDLRTAKTRELLLEAAAHVFSEKGFQQSSVREICRRAGLSGPGLINYHFRNKKELYREVLLLSLEIVQKTSLYERAVNRDASAGERLCAFVHMHLQYSLCSSRPAWFDKLVKREYFEPTDIMGEILRSDTLPAAKILKPIVEELLGTAARPDDVVHCCLCILGQCLFPGYIKGTIERVHPGWLTSPQKIEDWAAYITTFSLAGIREIREARAVPESRKNGPGC